MRFDADPGETLVQSTIVVYAVGAGVLVGLLLVSCFGTGALLHWFRWIFLVPGFLFAAIGSIANAANKRRALFNLDEKSLASRACVFASRAGLALALICFGAGLFSLGASFL